ncbi:hypothetical protein COOONC_25286 [Cooperia oncophora]
MPPKKFQQDLWKQRFTWDAKLPPPITVSKYNFLGALLRVWSPKISHCLQMQVKMQSRDVCALSLPNSFIHTGHGKGKLPSVKTTTAMPKLEMNALTLAVRLSPSLLHKAPPISVFGAPMIALSLLSSSKRRSLGVLVTNRLLEIRRIVQKLNEDGTNVTFAYVNTSEKSSGRWNPRTFERRTGQAHLVDRSIFLDTTTEVLV